MSDLTIGSERSRTPSRSRDENEFPEQPHNWWIRHVLVPVFVPIIVAVIAGVAAVIALRVAHVNATELVVHEMYIQQTYEASQLAVPGEADNDGIVEPPVVEVTPPVTDGSEQVIVEVTRIREVPVTVEVTRVSEGPVTEDACTPSHPEGWRAYTVRYRDTLWALAGRNMTTLQQIRNANCQFNDIIYVGETLWLPDYAVVEIPTIAVTRVIIDEPVEEPVEKPGEEPVTLTINRIWTESGNGVAQNQFTVGDTIRWVAEISNQGEARVETTVDFAVISPLESEVVTSQLNPAIENGTHQFALHHNVDESMIGANSFIVSLSYGDKTVQLVGHFTVVANETELTPADFYLLPDTQGGLCRRQETILTLVIVNGGESSGAMSVNISFGEFGTVAVDVMSFRDTVNVEVPIPRGCFDSNCEFSVALDVNNTVAESNEENNISRGVCLG